MSSWSFVIPALLITFMLFGSVQATYDTWLTDTTANWTAANTTLTDLQVVSNALKLATSKKIGSWSILKDFGENVGWLKINTSTYKIQTNGDNITLEIRVSDSDLFEKYQSKFFDVPNGETQTAAFLDISGLSTKRYAKIIIRINTTSGDPKVNYFELRFINDSDAPDTTVAPAGGSWVENNVSFTLACTDQTDGAGCNQSYYRLSSTNACGARLIGYWSFDAMDDTIVNESFNNLAGTLMPIQSKPQRTINSGGKVGEGLSFDDGTGRMEILDDPVEGQDYCNPLLNGISNNRFSIEVWIKAASFTEGGGSGGDPYIVSKWWGETIRGDYILKLNTTGHVIFTVANEDVEGSKQETINSTNPINQDWNFIAVTFYNGEMKMYINGQLAAPPYESSSVRYTQAKNYTHDDIYVGASWSDDNNFKGVIDELRLYQGALTADEVTAHYNLREFWNVYSGSGEAGCNPGEKCTWYACAYSKDNNDNMAAVGTPKQTYMINKENLQCSVEVNPQVGKNFTVNVSTSEVGVSSMKIIWGSTSAMTDSQYVTCTHTNPPFSGAYECSGLSNASLFLACSATGTSGAVSNSTATPVAVDVIDPSCTVRRTGNNVTCECSDPGSSIKSIECAIKDGTNYLSLSTQGCTLSSLACNGTTCNVTATCTTLADQVLFVRGTDKVSNLAAWKNSTETCTDDDGDDYCKEDDDCNDADAEINPDGIEVCDGVDNNCDGQIDETWKAAPWNLTAVCGTGACSGTMVCNDDGNGTICNVPTTVGVEICDDDIDNDCDGTVDEEVDSAGNSACSCKNGTSRLCGSKLGICKEGNQTCSNNAWSVCVGQIAPQTEICKDELDNDCDGQVDEADCACEAGDTKPCGSNIGACEEGYRVCVNGEWGDECKGAVLPGTEFCDDNIDNDCDGDTDESSCTYKQDIGKICSNKQLDDGEEGVDCGGICDTACPAIAMWMIVAFVAVIVIIITGVIAALQRG